MKYIKIFYWFFIVIVLSISCTSDMDKIKTVTNINDLPDEWAKNIEIVHLDSAKITMIVKASELFKYDNVDEAYTEFKKGLNVKFYNEEGTQDSEMSANYAKRIDKTAIWEARNNVVAINREGTKLNTELLYWDENKEIIYTDKFVKVTEGESILYGNGLESNQEFTEWRILHPTGEIYSDE